jgi:uncharacterized membrane protein YkoI
MKTRPPPAGAEKESKVMIRARAILAALAGAAALGTAGAAVVSSGERGIALPDAKMVLAQAGAEQPAAPPSSTVPGPRTSLAQAVGVAEQRTGGRAMRAKMDRERGGYLYEIKTVSKDKSATVLVDPASGNVVRVDEPGLVGRVAAVFDRDDQRKEQTLLAGLEASPMTLAGAIAAAEKETGGRAVRAGSADQYGSILFAVQLIKDAAMLRVHVESATGKVIAIPNRKDDD